MTLVTQKAQNLFDLIPLFDYFMIRSGKLSESEGQKNNRKLKAHCALFLRSFLNEEMIHPWITLRTVVILPFKFSHEPGICKGKRW